MRAYKNLSRSFGLALLAWCCLATAAGTGSPASGIEGNRLSSFDTLHGRYIAIRHGESVPSRAGLICSSMEHGADPRNGLTPAGRVEVVAAVRAWATEHRAMLEAAAADGNITIVTSPFSRTRETAGIAADVLDQVLGLPPSASLHEHVEIEPDLRERFFGELEGRGPSDALYRSVWERDLQDATQTVEGVESAVAVQARATAVIGRLEQRAAKSMQAPLFLLVSHGDTLKILQTGFLRVNAGSHADRSVVTPFRTAELRELTLR